MIPLDLGDLGASFYVGNCHKWLCSPKGAGFLWAAPGYREALRPPTISHGWNGEYPHSATPYHARFDWTGTDDRTAWMVVPAALDTMASLAPDGWPGVMAANRALALAARDLLDDRLQLAPGAPETMIGSMVALSPIPSDDPWRLKWRLRDIHGIELAMTPWTEGTIVIRVSAQMYNQLGDYEHLADALRSEL